MAAREGDQILIAALKQIGCELPDDADTFAAFTNHIVAHVTVKFVTLANPDVKLKDRLPGGAAARQRYCKKLGSLVEGLGYQGNSSYNQFLYPTEGETRSLVRWMVGQIPKLNAADAVEDDVAAGSGGLSQRVVDALKGWQTQLWTPPFLASERSRCQRRLATVNMDVPTIKRASSARQEYMNKFLPYVHQQTPNPEEVAASLLERNFVAVTLELEREADWSNAELDPVTHRAQKQDAVDKLKRSAFAGSAQRGNAIAGTRAAAGTGKGLQDILDGYKGTAAGKGTAFSHQAEFGTERTGGGAEAGDGDDDAGESNNAEEGEKPAAVERKDEATLQREREEELARLEQRIVDAKTKSANAATAAKDIMGRMRQLTAAITQARGKSEELQTAYKLKKKTLEMLPEAAKHIAKLQQICGVSAGKLLSLAAEWEQHRRPIIEAIRQHKESKSLRKDACKQKVVDIKRMRSEMQAMAGDIREKERRVVELEEQFARMPKDLNRAVYTYRIMDIIKQLRKQKVEINKVISNIREVQSQINAVTAKLKRTEALADEQLYQTARESKDAAHVESYRHLASLREIFDKLIGIAEASGHATNAQRDLEAKAEQLQASTSARNMERLLSDLEQVRKENAEVKAAIKAAKKQQAGN